MGEFSPSNSIFKKWGAYEGDDFLQLKPAMYNNEYCYSGANEKLTG